MSRTYFDDDMSFEQFLSKGILGPLSPGMLYAEVYRRLGKPDETHYQSFDEPKWLEIDDVEIITSEGSEPSKGSYLGRTKSSTQRQDPSQGILSLYYGNLKLTFEDGKLTFITVDFRYDSYGLPKVLNIHWFEDVRQMNVIGFKDLLQKKGLPCYRVVGQEGLLLIGEPGVEISVSDEDTGSLLVLSYSNCEPASWALEKCWE
jgi:hypothetical protein